MLEQVGGGVQPDIQKANKLIQGWESSEPNARLQRDLEVLEVEPRPLALDGECLACVAGGGGGLLLVETVETYFVGVSKVQQAEELKKFGNVMSIALECTP